MKNKMINNAKRYTWVWEWFASAVLIAFAITAVITNAFLVYAFGCIFIIFALFRIVPLFQTTESKLIKVFTIVEFIVDLGAGVCLFVFAEKMNSSTNIFGYVIGGVLYLRGFMHFLSTSVKNEPSTFMGFVANIVLITVSTIIITRGGFSSSVLAWTFFTIIIICAAVIVFKGYTDYRNYRGNLVGESKTKKLKVNEQKVITNPTSDEIKINIVDEKEKHEEARL